MKPLHSEAEAREERDRLAPTAFLVYRRGPFDSMLYSYATPADWPRMERAWNRVPGDTPPADTPPAAAPRAGGLTLTHTGEWTPDGLVLTPVPGVEQQPGPRVVSYIRVLSGDPRISNTAYTATVQDPDGTQHSVQDDVVPVAPAPGVGWAGERRLACATCRAAAVEGPCAHEWAVLEAGAYGAVRVARVEAAGA